MRSSSLFTFLSLVLTPLLYQNIYGQENKRPNILFIIADDQTPFDLKIYDSESTLDTPHIDRLASVGMVIDQTYHMGAWVSGAPRPDT